jgi:hypothetical protein
MTIPHGGNICPRRNAGQLTGLGAATEEKTWNIFPQPEVNGGLRLLELINNEWSESRKGGESKGRQYNGQQNERLSRRGSPLKNRLPDRASPADHGKWDLIAEIQIKQRLTQGDINTLRMTTEASTRRSCHLSIVLLDLLEKEDRKVKYTETHLTLLLLHLVEKEDLIENLTEPDNDNEN